MAPLLWTVIRTLTIEIWKRPADLSDVTSAGFSLGGHSALALAGARVSKDAYIEYNDAHIGMLDCGWMTRGGVDFNDIDYKEHKIDCDYKKIKMDTQRKLIETFL